MPYIEVLASVRVERVVEAYEVTLELFTSASKNVACFQRALELREEIVALMKRVGLTDSDIREGGGEANQDSWSSKKWIVHRIALRSPNMDVMMSAIAATERHFAALPRPFFGGTKQNFTFHTPVPVYARNVSTDDALRKAMQDARKTAELIANESGVRLGPMISVVELYPERYQDSQTESRQHFPDEGMDFCVSDSSVGAINYTDLPKKTANASQRFTIRYAAEVAERSEGPGAEDNDAPGASGSALPRGR